MPYIFKNFIMFKATIPHEFRTIKDDYLLTTNIKIDTNLSERVRHFVFHKNNHFVENQKVPPTNSFFSTFDIKTMSYSYNISDIEIQLEIFEDEIDSMQSYFSHGNIGILELSSIFQNVLVIFSHLYNESLGGLEFFKPVADYYGPFTSRLCLEKELEGNKFIFSGSYSLDRNSTTDILDIEKITPMQWRLFFNKAKNSYILYDNLDTILESAISLESYVIYLIRENKLEQDFELYKSGKKQISFFQEVDYLKRNKIIDKSKADDLNSVFGKLKDYRNSIVHGDLESSFMSRKIALECIEEVKNFYKKYESNNIK